MNFLKKNIWLLLLISVCLIFFHPFFIQGKIPIPADALAGMYHPFRDELAHNYPNGYPFKNPLITDPVRQQYPYRFLAINLLKQGQLPKWNPYSFSGTPLLSNIQTAVFYPFNILFWIFNFNFVWSVQILLQPLLAGIFMYFYLRSLKLTPSAAFLGSLAFAYGGFMTVWMEWNTLGHAALWLPLILLAIDKATDKFSLKWLTVLFISLICSFLAGHLQTTFYVWGFSAVYLLVRIIQYYHKCHCEPEGRGNLTVQEDCLPAGRQASSPFRFLAMTKRINCIYLIICIILIILFLSQLLPAVNFISLSARSFDLTNWQRADWFIPWQNLVQFLAPDFFGNPATGNYWGVWNYAEFSGFIGIIPLIFAFLAMTIRKDLKTLFFGTSFFMILFLGLPTFPAKIPYILHIPFLSTLQPSRIMILIDFSLAVLSALGWDYFIKMNNLFPFSAVIASRPQAEKQSSYRPEDSNLILKSLLIIVSITGLLMAILLAFTIFRVALFSNTEIINNLAIAQRNLILPILILIIFSLLILVFNYFSNKKYHYLPHLLFLLVLLLSAFDLFRFFHKFNPFVNPELIYPQTKTTDFLQKNTGNYRIMTMDRQILAPDVSTYYKLQDVAGYDPLYLKNYGELMAAWTRNSPDISPAQFNRILTPQNYNSFLADLMGVKYILSLQDEVSPKLKPVFEQGSLRIYENLKAFPRAFLVQETVETSGRQEALSLMFADPQKLSQIAYTENGLYVRSMKLEASESAQITDYSENLVQIKTNTAYERLLILTDIYHPDWQVTVNSRPSSISPVDGFFRGVVVPTGESVVEFIN